MRSDGLRRFWGLALALVAGCGDQANADGGGETNGVETTGDDPTTGAVGDELCVPGYEGCPCFEDARCISGLQCLSSHCVSVPDETSGDTVASDESTSSASESTSDDAAEASSSSGDEESSSSGLPDVCVDDDTYCDDDELQTCVDGQWELADCEDLCDVGGYASGVCADADRCLCSGHNDAVCDDASYNHCICIEILYGEVACTSEQNEMEYQACFADTTPANICWSEQQLSVVEDCEIAVAECGA